MKKKRAFTLIELLVVIGIIALLAGLLIPAVVRTKESGRAAACLSNLHQIGVALQLYVQDNQNLLPVMSDKSTNPPVGPVLPPPNLVLSNHVGSVQVFRCPSDRVVWFELTGSSYSWNILLNGQNADQITLLDINVSPHKVPVMFDKEKFHQSRGDLRAINWLYADGHLKNLSELSGGQ